MLLYFPTILRVILNIRSSQMQIFSMLVKYSFFFFSLKVFYLMLAFILLGGAIAIADIVVTTPTICCCGIQFSYFYWCFVLHYAGPVSNILVVRRPHYLSLGAFSNANASSRRHGSLLPPPLDKYVNLTDEGLNNKTVIRLPTACNIPQDALYCSSRIIDEHIEDFQVFNCLYFKDVLYPLLLSWIWSLLYYCYFILFCA